MNRFWSGGAEVFDKALQSQCRAELEKLCAQLKTAGTESERLELERQIAGLTETYRQKSRAIRRSLF